MNIEAYQCLILDYLEVSDSPEDVIKNIVNEVDEELLIYIKSWSKPQVALAQFLLDKWGIKK